MCYVPSRYAGRHRRRCSTCRTPRAAAAAQDPIRWRDASSSPKASRCRVRCRRSSAAAPSAQIYIHPGERHSRGHLHVDLGRADGTSRSAASRRRRSSASTIPTARRSSPTSQRGPVRASIRTWLREGWMRCLLPVAEIRGQRAIRTSSCSCTATTTPGTKASATTRPATRRCSSWRGCCGRLRDRLKRSVRIAWWPGHSTGRYAGSTWYADTFADEIDEHCIAQLDIDSPGLRRRDRLRGSHVDGRSGCAVPVVDPRRARLSIRARPAAARRRLLLQPDRPDRPLHAAVEHPDRGAQAPRLLRGRRLRRQHRLAHAGRSDAGRRSRDPPSRPGGVSDDDRADPQRAAAPVRLRARRSTEIARGGRPVPAGGRRRGRLRHRSSKRWAALRDDLRRGAHEAEARIGRGAGRRRRAAPA